MAEKYIKDGKYYEKGAGLFGSDKEIGVVQPGGLFQDTIKMHDFFTPDLKIEKTGWFGENTDIVGKDTLSEFIEGKREGTRLETDERILYSIPTSYEWVQTLGGPKIPKNQKSSGAGKGVTDVSGNANRRSGTSDVCRSEQRVAGTSIGSQNRFCNTNTKSADKEPGLISSVLGAVCGLIVMGVLLTAISQPLDKK